MSDSRDGMYLIHTMEFGVDLMMIENYKFGETFVRHEETLQRVTKMWAGKDSV